MPKRVGDIDRAMPKLEELFRLHSRELYWIAMAFCGDKQLAEDAVQESFLQICEDPHKLQEVSNVRAYLVRMTKNYLIDHFRKRQVEQKHEAQVADEINALQALEENAEEYQELLSKAKKMLDSLPAGCRRMFVMAAVEGLSYKEIAEREEVSVNTVKTQLRIARKRLKGELIVVLIVLIEVLK